MGFNISQVVHDYGDICQAITEVAVEQRLPITTEEFHTLNRCLDAAIAGAVTEHARITAESRSTEEIERSGRLAHEIRDILNTAILAFHTLKRGTVAINGSTGAVLGRSLIGLRDLVNSTLSEIRVDANIQRAERVPVGIFLSEIEVAGNLHAEYRELQFGIEAVDPELAVTADPQLLASAVMNLLNNAFKYTQSRRARGGPSAASGPACAHRSGGSMRRHSPTAPKTRSSRSLTDAERIGQGSASGSRSPAGPSACRGGTSTSATCLAWAACL